MKRKNYIIKYYAQIGQREITGAFTSSLYVTDVITGLNTELSKTTQMRVVTRPATYTGKKIFRLNNEIPFVGIAWNNDERVDFNGYLIAPSPV